MVQKLNDVKYFTCLVTIVTTDVGCTSEMKSGLPWQTQHVTIWRLFSLRNLN